MTIPRAIRERLGVGPGDTVEFTTANGRVELRKLPDPAERERLLAAIMDVRRRRPARLGMSTDEYMALIRDEQ